jgi:hypothetical protein
MTEQPRLPAAASVWQRKKTKTKKKQRSFRIRIHFILVVDTEPKKLFNFARLILNVVADQTNEKKTSILKVCSENRLFAKDVVAIVFL